MENHFNAITSSHRLGCSTPTGTGVLFEDKLALHEGSAGTGGALAADFPEDASPAADAQSHKHHVSFQEPSGPDSQGSDDAGGAQTGADQAERRQAALDSVLNPQTAQWERYPEVPCLTAFTAASRLHCRCVYAMLRVMLPGQGPGLPFIISSGSDCPAAAWGKRRGADGQRRQQRLRRQRQQVPRHAAAGAGAPTGQHRRGGVRAQLLDPCLLC